MLEAAGGLKGDSLFNQFSAFASARSALLYRLSLFVRGLQGVL